MQILLCRLSRVILAIPSPGLKDLLSPSVSRQPAWFECYALNDEILRLPLPKEEKRDEGMFAALSVVDFGSAEIAAGPPVGYQIPSADGGYYMAYNVMAVTP